jgi:hypothetical protein
VIAGEEPEMCVRLREKGWTIHRIDAEMTLHDAAITRFSQWWKRSLRSGHAYAQGYFLHGTQTPGRGRFLSDPAVPPARNKKHRKMGDGPDPAHACQRSSFVRCRAALVFLGVPPPAAVSFACDEGGAKSAAPEGCPVKRRPTRLLYGIFVVLGKFPQWLGVRRFRSAQRAASGLL